MKKVYSSILILGMLAGGRAFSQTGDVPHRLDPDLLQFFVGHWTGEGQFSNGKKIAANVEFQLSLDSSWLVYTHRDQPPNSYKADSYWGVDRQTGEFVAYCLDNFQGHRQFVSDGWKKGKMVLTAHAYLAGVGTYFEHFRFEKVSEKSFKMSYETSRDGISWMLGDELVFTKTGNSLN